MINKLDVLSFYLWLWIEKYDGRKFRIISYYENIPSRFFGGYIIPIVDGKKKGKNLFTTKSIDAIFEQMRSMY